MPVAPLVPPASAVATSQRRPVKVVTAPVVDESKPGVIVVAVAPRADVFIDGEAVGSTPVRKMVAPGVHSVRLVGNDGEVENLRVSVFPGKPVNVTRRWK